MIKVGITLGDINGIGPEIIIKALRDSRMFTEFTPIIYGSGRVLSFYKKTLNEEEFSYQTCKSSLEFIPKKVNLINVWNDEVKIEPGVINQTGGKYALLSLQNAVEDLASNKLDVLVTAPVCKEALQKNGFNFPGQTEFLADYAHSQQVLMIMCSEQCKVALVTTHIPIKEVPNKISSEIVFDKIICFEQSLKKDFGIIRPKIAVFGLNPHAGENGKIGDEEEKHIIPAIQKARKENVLAFGPFPADSFFGSKQIQQYDGILAMYHDQGLTAFKALSFEDGVNYSAGLPIVRTSPDHGTAFDIAGKNLASEFSFRNAIYLAVDIYKNRIHFKELNKNPLPLNNDKADKKVSPIE
ncbi:MAG: 4-hydroxythreonine-4-phosphate dehydrogenase PdxA [Flavobacteriia bacterium]|nr:4-hydroxythreonine-4-phosphate dehydrogenase PdxA [Flavobacteriia bacterium]